MTLDPGTVFYVGIAVTSGTNAGACTAVVKGFAVCSKMSGLGECVNISDPPVTGHFTCLSYLRIQDLMNCCGVFEIDSQRLEMGFAAIDFFVFG